MPKDVQKQGSFKKQQSLKKTGSVRKNSDAGKSKSALGKVGSILAIGRTESTGSVEMQLPSRQDDHDLSQIGDVLEMVPEDDEVRSPPSDCAVAEWGQGSYRRVGAGGGEASGAQEAAHWPQGMEHAYGHFDAAQAAILAPGRGRGGRLSVSPRHDACVPWPRA